MKSAAVGPIALWLLVGSASAGPISLLSPADGHKTGGGAAWLVFRSDTPPRVSVDGRGMGPPRGEEGVYHVRLEGLSAQGSRIEVQSARAVVRITVVGASDRPDRFHLRPPESCWECHEASVSGCNECHRWAGSKHKPVATGQCVLCHAAPGWETADIAPVCAECHREYGGGKHPRLRHPVSAARDPLRPGQRLDCASCHDPHTPTCLSCLGRPDLREWCKKCHSRQ